MLICKRRISTTVTLQILQPWLSFFICAITFRSIFTKLCSSSSEFSFFYFYVQTVLPNRLDFKTSRSSQIVLTQRLMSSDAVWRDHFDEVTCNKCSSQPIDYYHKSTIIINSLSSSFGYKHVRSSYGRYTARVTYRCALVGQIDGALVISGD